MDKLVKNDIRKSQYLTNKCAEYLKRSGFSIIHRKEEGEGLSGYTIYCEKNTTDTIFVVRISNHIAVLENFAKHYPAPLIAKPKLARRMGKNVQPRYKKQVFRSFVFKDFDIPENNTIPRKIVCPEYVFSPDNIYDNGLIDTVTNGISQSISSPDGQQPQICSVTPNIRIGRKQQLEENKQYRNTNTIMKQKQTIKLNESQLRGLIKESIKKVLKEGKVVNNKPWHSSQQYKDGYETTLRNRADWNEFLNDKSLHDNPNDMIRRAEEIIDSNGQRKREEWEKSEQKHSDRQYKNYEASPEFSDENRRKFVTQWIRNHYDREEWQDLSIEQKRESIECANNDFYDTVVNRNMDND